MKIFIVSQQFVGTMAGGEAVHVMQLAKELKKQKYNVFVLTLGIGNQPFCENCNLEDSDIEVPVVRFFTEDSVKISSPYEGNFTANIKRAREFSLQVLGYLRGQTDQENSIVHLHGHYMVPSLARELRQTTNYKIITTIHRAESIYESLGLLHHPERIQFMHEKEQDAINYSDRVVVRSNFVKNYLLELYQGRIVDKFTVIPSAVSESFALSPIPSDSEIKNLKERYGIKGMMILSFGIFEPLKGFEYSLQALPILKKKIKNNINFTFVLGGLLLKNHEWYYEKIKKIIRRLPISLKRSIKIMTNVNSETKKDLFNMTDIFLFTPVAEPFGIPLAEALSRSKICIASDCEGPRYILDFSDNFTESESFKVCKNGIIVKNEFSKRCNYIAEALFYVLKEFDNLKKIAENGKEHALSHLSWRQLIEAKINLYKEVIK